MLSFLLAVVMLGAEPKPVPGSEYYKEAVEALDNAKSEKAFAAAVVKINKKWIKKRIIVEFQVTNKINNILYINSLADSGDWRTFVFQSWLKQRADIGWTVTISGVPVIGETKTENEIGTLHAGGKSIKYRVDRAQIDARPN